jgi:polyisoprenoid-binding protein YceI
MKEKRKMARIELSGFRIFSVALALVQGCVLAVAPVFAEDTEAAVSPPGTLEFVGKNLIMKAKGTFHDWRVVESSVDLDAIGDAFAVVEVQLASLDTGIEGRDDHLRNPDFFEVDTYPVAMVRLHSPQPISDESDETEEQPRFAVQFDVNLHGVEKTLEGQIVLISTNPLVFEGELVIDRMEFGVGPKPGFWSPMVPKAEIPVRFHVEL